MQVRLSEHMTFPRLLKTSIPSILMMVSISVYSVVDGFFVSNYAGKTPFAAVNLIYPFIMVLGSLGFMMGTGGAALVAKELGEGKPEQARRHFFDAMVAVIILGIVSSILGYIFLPTIARALGSDEQMLPYCVEYGRILVLGITAFNLQNLFQSFFMAAERPTLGFIVTLTAGVTNIVLDALLIAVCKLGVLGAAIGTVAGQVVGAVIPLVYFASPNSSLLRLKAGVIDVKAVIKMAGNGSSELFNNISASAVSMVMNVLLMKYFGEDGVSSYGIICYVWLIYAAIFIGFNTAVSARVSYVYGAGDKKELRNLYTKSLIALAIFGVGEALLSLALTYPLAYAYAGYDAGLMDLTVKCSLIYSMVYVFLGINMFGSAYFTALNNGLVSVVLSVVRLALLEILLVWLMSLAMGGYGIFYGVVFAECLGVVMNVAVMQAFRKRYGYGKQQAENS